MSCGRMHSTSKRESAEYSFNAVARIGSAMGDHRGITPTITSYTGIRIAIQHSMHMYDTFGLKCGP